MKISHEVPICLLELSKLFNDYDYCLAHLYIKYDIYKQFYLASNRHVLLDNSANELRNDKYFDEELYFQIIKELNPDEYIIPDIFNNRELNNNSFNNWMNKYGKLLNNKTIGVIHGETYEELEQNYLELVDKVDKISINFDEIPFNSIYLSDNISINKSMNRLEFIFNMINKGIINTNKPHHILGCHIPQEFKYYKQFKWIETIDTSNPITSGYENNRYNDNYIIGLYDKPHTKIDNIINESLNQEQFDDICYNIKLFKKIIQ